jgi:excisionase family DNA binding protein
VHNQASFALPREDAVPPALLEAVGRAMMATLAPRQPAQAPRDRGEDGEDLPPLLSPQQAAGLMGVSRQTIDRMTADGELPSIVLREGSRQRMVRIPSAFMVMLLRDLNAGVQITLKDYTTRWLALAPAPASEVAAQRDVVPPGLA